MVNNFAPHAAHSDVLPQDRLHALYQIIQRMNSVYDLSELLALLLDQMLETRASRFHANVPEDIPLNWS